MKKILTEWRKASKIISEASVEDTIPPTKDWWGKQGKPQTSAPKPVDPRSDLLYKEFNFMQSKYKIPDELLTNKKLFHRYLKEMHAIVKLKLPNVKIPIKNGVPIFSALSKKAGGTRSVLGTLDKEWERISLGHKGKARHSQEWRWEGNKLVAEPEVPIEPDMLVDPKDPSKGLKPDKRMEWKRDKTSKIYGKPRQQKVVPVSQKVPKGTITSTEPTHIVSPKGAKRGTQMHYNIEGPVWDPKTGRAVPPPGYDPPKKPSTRVSKPRIPGKGAVGGAAGGIALAALFEVPDIAFEYNRRVQGETEKERWGRVWDKAKDRIPAIATMGLSDFYTGVKDILTAEDPKQKSREQGKSLAKAMGIMPTRKGERSYTDKPVLPMEQKPKTREDIPGPVSSTPLPKEHGADVHKGRPLYKVIDGKVTRVE